MDLDEALEMSIYAVHVGDRVAIQRWRAEVVSALGKQIEGGAQGEADKAAVTAGLGRDREQGVVNGASQPVFCPSRKARDE